MAVLPIRITGDTVLHTPAAPVGAIDDEVRTLVADMVETMHAAPGVGLAGPQVGVGKRLFVWSWTDEHGVESSGVAIDPVLWIAPTPIAEPTDDDEEGCLSIPGPREALVRSPAAILEATGLDGERFRIEATGWLARIFQHEYDHLDGILYADRLAHREWKSLEKAVEKARYGRPGLSWTPGINDVEA